MKSIASIPPVNRRRFTWALARATFGAAAAAHWAAPAWAQSQLPELGNAGDMSTAEERRLGNLIIADLYRDPDYVDDPVIAEYVTGIWSLLRESARQHGELTPEMDQNFAWRLVLGRDKEVNAFALPGGYMGVLMGMVAVVNSRDELASVLGHETGHIVQRHIARSISDQRRTTPLSIAALVAGVLAATQNPQAGMAIATGGQAAVVSHELAFSRANEREADRIGYSLMRPSFRPQGFIQMFQKLEAASRLNDNGEWPFLRTHPLTTERIADMQLRAQALPPSGPPPTDWEALLLAARARALSRPGVDTLRQWAKEPEETGFGTQEPKRRAPALYAAALAQAELRSLPPARALADALAKVVVDQPRGHYQARMLQAELALRANAPAQALQLLPAAAPVEATTQGNQTGRALLLLKARALVQAQRAGDAVALLQTQVANHPNDDGAWAALSQALEATGQKLRALRADGEVRMVQYDFAGAVARFQAAQDYARQHSGNDAGLIDASIVDARLTVARQALKDQKEEEKKWS